jgi:hypothetical protein
MSSLTEEQLERIKAENPGVELHLVSSPETGVDVVVRKPKEDEWRRFRAMQADDEQRSGALRLLAIHSSVFPKGAEFMAMLAEFPGMAETVGAKLIKIAGVDGTATSRKL